MSDRWAGIGKYGKKRGGIGKRRQPLNSEHQLNVDPGGLIEGIADVPRAVGGLSPSGPGECDVRLNPWRDSLAGESIRCLPTHIAEQHVGVESLLECLPFKECALEGIAQGADDVGENMIKHIVTLSGGS